MKPIGLVVYNRQERAMQDRLAATLGCSLYQDSLSWAVVHEASMDADGPIRHGWTPSLHDALKQELW